jgi:hypothetical protein
MSDEIFSSFRECLIPPRRKNGMKTVKCVVLVMIFTLCCVDPGLTLTQEKRNTPTPETRPESSESTAEEQLDVNTASMQELLLIPGLEEEQVLAIINGRPYERAEELLDISGIDEPLLDIMRALITIMPVEEEREESQDTQEDKQEKRQDEKEKRQDGKEKRQDEKAKEKEKRREEKQKEKEKRQAEKEREQEKRQAEKEREQKKR